jgi:rRNA-processing protein FCF1
MSLVDMAGLDRGAGLLIGTNLLVLFAVGRVNRNRIQDFKRTSGYDHEDYDLLVRTMERFGKLFTVAHVMAEVSNLIDLAGREGLQARRVLAATIAILHEPHVPSLQAAGGSYYEAPGLADSAISIAAREKKCSVLTDDLDLYRSLAKEGLPVVKVSHLRERNWQRG